MPNNETLLASNARDLNMNLSPLSFLARDLDRPLMLLDDLLCYRQAKSRATAARSRMRSLVKTIEYMRKVSFRDANARILHCYPERRAVLGKRRRDMAMFRRIVDGILYDILDGPLKMIQMALDKGIAFRRIGKREFYIL